ncbi:MAG: cbcC [Acidobacteria bacterium]|nr:cbcC [Acidobacteriota bacterium]
MNLKKPFRSKRAVPMALAFAIALCCGAHAGKKDGGFVVYSGEHSGPVVFSHVTHGNRAGYPCKACHSSDSGAVLAITMGSIRSGRACGECHNGRTKAPRGGEAASPIENCGSCHMPAIDIVFNLNRMDPVRFSHVRHLSVVPGKKTSSPAGFSCGNCHPLPFDRASGRSWMMEVPHESGGCAGCHKGIKHRGNARPAFAATTRCLTCHRR